MTRKERSEKMKAIWADKRKANLIPNTMERLDDKVNEVEKSRTLYVTLSKTKGVIKFVNVADNLGNSLNFQFEEQTFLKIQEV